MEQFVPGTALLTLRQCCEPDPRAFAVSVLYDAHIILFKNKTAVSFYLAGGFATVRQSPATTKKAEPFGSAFLLVRETGL